MLEQHLRAHGKPKPSPKHTAHHIVPGKGKTQFAADARIEMHLHGIRINDPYNGVWMLRKKEYKPHWSMPNSHAHLEIHTHNYEKWVFNRLVLADDRREAEMALNLIGKLLQDGNQPPEVTMPPNDSWNA
ncbi:AHH domain-containing protein [Endozoicomonas numazuensis]|uniref:AHH domain-containing protein n=1 Tax=Endozoicomonas numazuensis TaxID=1137799 RepID=UPI00068BBAF9